jgi:hypothetical protein
MIVMFVGNSRYTSRIRTQVQDGVGREKMEKQEKGSIAKKEEKENMKSGQRRGKKERRWKYLTRKKSNSPRLAARAGWFVFELPPERTAGPQNYDW